MASPPRSTGTPLIFRSTPTPRLFKQPARSADSDVTPQKIRDGFDTMAEIASGAPVAEVSVHDRTIPGPAGNIPIRLYHPPCTGSIRRNRLVPPGRRCDRRSRNRPHPLHDAPDACQAVVISVDYRLAPKHPFPADVVDSLAAYQWVIDHADGLGIDPARAARRWHSQGGKISAVVCRNVAEKACSTGRPDPALSGPRRHLAGRFARHDGGGVAAANLLQFFAMGGDHRRQCRRSQGQPGLEPNPPGSHRR